MDNMWYILTMEYYSAMKNTGYNMNEIQSLSYKMGKKKGEKLHIYDSIYMKCSEKVPW